MAKVPFHWCWKQGGHGGAGPPDFELGGGPWGHSLVAINRASTSKKQPVNCNAKLAILYSQPCNLQAAGKCFNIAKQCSLTGWIQENPTENIKSVTNLRTLDECYREQKDHV